MIVAKNANLAMLPRYVGRPLVLLLLLDVAIAAAYVFAGWKWLALPHLPLSIFGGLIGVIAGFRNASAYARWWEARTIWGAIVNSSRTFAREVLSMLPHTAEGGTMGCGPCEMQRKLIMHQIAYVHTLRNHLRGNPPWKELAAYIPDHDLQRLKTKSNVPLAVQLDIALLLAKCYQLGWIDNIRWTRLDETLSSLMDCQGASERIKNTPMPRLYDQFIRCSIRIYCLLLPLGMVQSLGLLTPLGSTFVGFIFMALDQIGRDLETPFENQPNDISMTAISRNIEINLRQMMDDAQIPEPVAPVNGILW